MLKSELAASSSQADLADPMDGTNRAGVEGRNGQSTERGARIPRRKPVPTPRSSVANTSGSGEGPYVELPAVERSVEVPAIERPVEVQ